MYSYLFYLFYVAIYFILMIFIHICFSYYRSGNNGTVNTKHGLFFFVNIFIIADSLYIYIYIILAIRDTSHLVFHRVVLPQFECLFSQHRRSLWLATKVLMTEASQGSCRRLGSGWCQMLHQRVQEQLCRLLQW